MVEQSDLEISTDRRLNHIERNFGLVIVAWISRVLHALPKGEVVKPSYKPIPLPDRETLSDAEILCGVLSLRHFWLASCCSLSLGGWWPRNLAPRNLARRLWQKQDSRK